MRTHDGTLCIIDIIMRFRHLPEFASFKEMIWHASNRLREEDWQWKTYIPTIWWLNHSTQGSYLVSRFCGWKKCSDGVVVRCDLPWLDLYDLWLTKHSISLIRPNGFTVACMQMVSLRNNWWRLLCALRFVDRRFTTVNRGNKESVLPKLRFSKWSWFWATSTSLIEHVECAVDRPCVLKLQLAVTQEHFP